MKHKFEVGQTAYHGDASEQKLFKGVVSRIEEGHTPEDTLYVLVEGDSSKEYAFYEDELSDSEFGALYVPSGCYVTSQERHTYKPSYYYPMPPMMVINLTCKTDL